MYFDSPGYLVADALGTEDYSIALQYINTQWAYVISQNHHDASTLILNDDLTILDYCKLLSLIDHNTLWPKSNRILPPSFVRWFLDTAFMTSISKLFPDFIISDEENLGYPNFYWRLVVLIPLLI